MQHCAKHVLWALSQQKLPPSALHGHLAQCCSLLRKHMALPIAIEGCRCAILPCCKSLVSATLAVPLAHTNVGMQCKAPDDGDAQICEAFHPSSVPMQESCVHCLCCGSSAGPGQGYSTQPTSM